MITHATTDDTIAAISTAPGEAGIAIIRVSGPDALALADRLFQGRVRPSAAPPRQALYGRICVRQAEATEALDEVLLLLFRAPHSYTGEDVVEIQGHGGRAVAARLLRAVLQAGARLAEPGEFTRRAFLNGRIDLLQAEAVADLIRAQADRAAAIAIEQLSGSLSDSYANIYDNIVCTCADLEATIDFVDDELPPTIPHEIRGRLQRVADQLDGLLATGLAGQMLREGAVVAIAGEPNVGKSTLMNRLLGRERSIVHPEPGTTRDTIEELLVLDGVLVRLVDTAGLRETTNMIEREGVRRAEDAARVAQIRLVVLDASRALSSASRTLLAGLPVDQSVLVLNKLDLGLAIDEADLPVGSIVVKTSLLQTGAESAAGVREALAQRLTANAAAVSHAAISERHRVATQAAREAVEEALGLLDRKDVDGGLLAAQALRAALQELGGVTGRVYSDELLDSIFSRFCIGK